MKMAFCGLAVALALLSPALAQAQGEAPRGRAVVAIKRMDDLAHTGQAATFNAMIETAIAATNKFRVIERSRLDELLQEQQQANAGLVTSNHPGKVGGFEGADFLIYGTITTFGVTHRSDLGTSVGTTLLSGFLTGNRQMANCSNAYGTLGLDIKITNASTGEVRYVGHIDETQKSDSVCGGQGQIDGPALMRSAADKVASLLVTTIYPIQIAAVQSDGVMILNYGGGTVQPGAVMTVFSKGQAIIDPATGETIANEEVKLGLIRITDVGARTSKAIPVSPFASPPPIGSIVRPANPAEVEGDRKVRR